MLLEDISLALFDGQMSIHGVDLLHEGVGEADFGPINSAIAGRFDESKKVDILRIQDDTVDGLLPSNQI